MSPFYYHFLKVRLLSLLKKFTFCSFLGFRIPNSVDLSILEQTRGKELFHIQNMRSHTALSVSKLNFSQDLEIVIMNFFPPKIGDDRSFEC